jgi:hypothetical protein
MLRGPLGEVAGEPHIWWGVSVEDRNYGLARIADLQAAPAAVPFLSVEPLLEDVGKLPLDGIAWVIVGGESGPGARPLKEDWVLSIREQCNGCGRRVLRCSIGSGSSGCRIGPAFMSSRFTSHLIGVYISFRLLGARPATARDHAPGGPACGSPRQTYIRQVRAKAWALGSICSRTPSAADPVLMT